ncbi:MAG: neutral/alkaline non-lysosomal ceramidase N-terminal domain-containing protein, partial [Aeoliella sp.]
MHFGFAKVDVTPTEPVRLSGYGDRDRPLEGVDEALFARVMALRYGTGKIHLLVAVDTIGFPAYLTKKIHAQVEQKYQVARSQFALCGTHSHTAPHLDLVNMINLYATPLTDAEKAATQRYGKALSEQIVVACGQAISDLQPGKLFMAEGEATFAMNRRIIKDGICVGMAPNLAGPVDHSVPILKITDATGKVVRGLVFNYACHCTTFSGAHNRVNGDWAGYAAKYLEQTHPDCVALCTIGCGADANSQRNTGHDLEAAQLQGKQLADEVERLGKGPMAEISTRLESNFGYAGLPIERQSIDKFKEKLNDRSSQVRSHAQRMIATHQRMGRLPESYPMPIQVWRFGDELTMVFLGGEVCVEYALRTKREITQGAVWVTAYANDLFGYVAPESMRSEGGYEVDFSMIYYNKPGRWSSGTEEIIFRELHQLQSNSVPARPLSPEQALESFSIPEGFAVEVVATEPLIVDPVNFAIGPDGRLWVVEMSDYPRGAHDDGEPGGRVKVLSDTDGDGHYDNAELFLDKLKYPTGVMPWRDGALVSCVPDIFFAMDTDGDGQADARKVLYTNFSEGNPQHLMSGFTRGLDNWIYLAAGDDQGTVRCVKSGEEVSISGRDARIRPDAGLIEAVSGRSQYGRCRDDWNHWFGNTNGEPLLHFVIEDHYLARNPFVPAPTPSVAMTDPPVAPPVYPTSRTVNRFNDLFDADRFTSACSPLLFRDTTLGIDVEGAALICEPVHNLVSRLMLSPQGITYQGQRHPQEQSSEFLSSTDPWFRPVRLATGPDGALWVADMYRQVIEHPEWIPEDWQVKLDLYAGRRQGRIYRVFRVDVPVTPTPDLTQLTLDKLVQELGAENGWRRDSAQQLLVQQNDARAVPLLQVMVADDPRPLARLHALAVLDGMDQLSAELVRAALEDEDPRIITWATKLAESKFSSHPGLIDYLLGLTDHADPHVRFQLALSLGEAEHQDVGKALLQLALKDREDDWIRAAVISSSKHSAQKMLTLLLQQTSEIDNRQRLIQGLIATTLGEDVADGTKRIVRSILSTEKTDEFHDWQFSALASCISALGRRNLSWDSVASNNPELAMAARPLFAASREIAEDSSAPLNRRMAVVHLLGRETANRADDLQLLENLLSPREPPVLQNAAVAALASNQPDDLAQRLLSDWKSRGPQLQSEILATLMSRQEWASQLI